MTLKKLGNDSYGIPTVQGIVSKTTIIAQLASYNRLILLNDEDFATIAKLSHAMPEQFREALIIKCSELEAVLAEIALADQEEVE